MSSKSKNKKNKLKSFVEFREQQILENLGSQAKQMAGMTMGDPHQVHQQATQAGVNTSKYFRIMSKWLNEIEEKMNLRGQQGGEQANNWHEQAVQVLQSALLMAAGGKQQWQTGGQLRNAQNAAERAKSNQPQQPQQQQQPPQQQPNTGGGGGSGPTPLNNIA